ncbi:hypothetical protein RZS08_08740, partial [Arthrospira platensis SPKY1]|nr:hypothetical protein [Arthrospira platensis SPKY1]
MGSRRNQRQPQPYAHAVGTIVEGQFAACGAGALAHVIEAAPGRAAGPEAATIVGDFDEGARSSDPGAHGQGSSAGVLEHVGDGLLQDAQHLQHLAGAKIVQRGHVVDPPDQLEPTTGQLAFQPGAKHAEHQSEIAFDGVQRIDHQPQIVQRRAQRLGDGRGLGRAAFRQRQGRDQMSAHAVVHVAYDAPALLIQHPLAL